MTYSQCNNKHAVSWFIISQAALATYFKICVTVASLQYLPVLCQCKAQISLYYAVNSLRET